MWLSFDYERVTEINLFATSHPAVNVMQIFKTFDYATSPRIVRNVLESVVPLILTGPCVVKPSGILAKLSPVYILRRCNPLHRSDNLKFRLFRPSCRLPSTGCLRSLVCCILLQLISSTPNL